MGVKDELLDKRKRKAEPKTGGEGGASTRFTRHREEKPEFGDVDPALLHEAITRLLAAGDAIMLGTTSDGGAVSFTVLSGSERTKDYAHNQEELEYILRGISEEYA